MPVHCWEEGPPLKAECPGGEWTPCDSVYHYAGTHLISTSCILLDGHEGDHEFTPDDEITVEFAAQQEAA